MSQSSSHDYDTFGRGSWSETRRIGDILRKETVGGALLIIGAVVALLWANSPWSEAYQSMVSYKIGPESLHLDLTISHWAADGLLAIFFFVVGLELKREFVAGDLRDIRKAIVPVVAAIGGVVAPALIYVAFNIGGATQGWAIPTATDIAFAVAILAVAGPFLPAALRMFLLTLAVVDDLIAILIIAIFFTDDLAIGPLLLALVPLGIFTFLVQKRVRSWYLLLPLAIVTWALVHASGVHATIAGVALGMVVPVIRSERAGGPDAGPGLAEHFEHRFRPLSAGVAVPIFAFMAAGVPIGGLSGLVEAWQEPVSLGVMTGLVLGKTIGIVGGAWLATKITRGRMAEGLNWVDAVGLALLGGIGFTVSLLIGELAFGVGTPEDDHVRIAILSGSILAAVLGTIVLRARNRVYKRLHEIENRDEDADGVPDVYQTGSDDSSK
ncbi:MULTISPECIES: Na+/H+ antiporter NhaA [Prauserella salsuginis group]|uniref:Na(+)/H(+) antiporter NhaA n=1 Tax=Prauserella salsuginis TaxID=387889 RepID=A0ABW6FXM3_9PSEU|nr:MULTISPECIES: Na+/H+ antiporter NhaA [Prauserella salsuginis group]MCR3721018.1 Na+:H+ antiporter, NhaA family [Prauserella flava]MCR3734901.1 Na+:H+ antiporter, NhaA family [Prauserella salsuginis]